MEPDLKRRNAQRVRRPVPQAQCVPKTVNKSPFCQFCARVCVSDEPLSCSPSNIHDAERCDRHLPCSLTDRACKQRSQHPTALQHGCREAHDGDLPLLFPSLLSPSASTDIAKKFVDICCSAVRSQQQGMTGNVLLQFHID